MADLTSWINPENDRPKHGQKIIVESLIGLYWGVYYTINDGCVYIEGKEHDSTDWCDILSWIPYPDDFGS